MDLVDIDQVLDNLELRESAIEGQANSINNLQAKSEIKVEQNVARINAFDSGSTKSFVGVSQVFNSLYDYSKNIQNLENAADQKYDEECRSIAANRTVDSRNHQTAGLLGGATVSEKTASENTAATKYSKYTANDFLECNSEEETSTDIQKFTDCSKRSVVKEPYTEESLSTDLTSDSLTTSSPSSFSSGPSPGLESGTEGHSIPLSPEESSMAGQQSCIRPYATEDSIDANDDMSSSKQICDELAESLSTVSITTENLQLNVATSSAFHAENISLAENAECEQTSKLIDNAARNGCQPNQIDENYVELTKQGLEEELLPPESSKQQKPLTFCSTMDDISDTELDSMLQDMDIDEVENVVQQKEKLIDSDSKQEGTIAKAKANQVVTTDGLESTGDCFNADNFSVASTVEFTEIRGGSDNCQLPEDDRAACNSIASSYASSDFSLEGQLEHEEDVADGISEDRPQRPKTLPLPNAQECMYLNAGLTPPGDVAELAQQPADSMLDNLGDNLINNEAMESEIGEASGYSDPFGNIGKIPPVWVPDNMATACMQCNIKFTMIKRRHHCRACGKVLCSVCCSQKHKLEFVVEPESRVCVQCYLILTRREQNQIDSDKNTEAPSNTSTTPLKSPNPNNPMEYCSTIPPHRQVTSIPSEPPSVVVPVGVLKKDGSYSSNSSNSTSQKARKRKSVMFSDGIAPGSDLAIIESQWGEPKQARKGIPQSHNGQSNTNKKPSTPINTEEITDNASMGLMAQLFRGALPPSAAAAAVSAVQGSKSVNSFNNGLTFSSTTPVAEAPKPETRNYRLKRLPPSGCDETGSFIPKDDNFLPPVCPNKIEQGSSYNFTEISNDFDLVKKLEHEPLKFALRKNLYVFVKIVKLTCCMNRTVLNFTTLGMHNVGNDEIVILLEYDPPATKEDMTEPPIPKDIFIHLINIYNEANMGNPITELSYKCPEGNNFLGSTEFGGFIYIRATFQCLQEIIVPDNPFLIGILIQRSEVPWAKVFPLRLILRLGAQYRYYPCPHISIRNRDPVYAEIAQTIMNFLADFRNYSYTLPCIRGMFIHMEDRQTTVLLPRNRLDDVVKAVNNSSDHILAFGGNFSKIADGHLVCIQNVNDKNTELYAYSTQAINIQGQPRKVTGANFLVLNESLKNSSGLSGKCSIVEDGLMVQILPTKMEEVRNALKNQKDVDIVCGPLNADEKKNEIVTFKWVDSDTSFNVGVSSPIDRKQLDGISSLRMHANLKYANSNYFLRFTEVFILQHPAWYNAGQSKTETIAQDLTRTADLLAQSAALALVPFLDLLVAGGSTKLGLRVTLDQENVCYEAGTRGSKLPPLYMNALDNHLIPSLHSESSDIDDAIVLELIFFILNA